MQLKDKKAIQEELQDNKRIEVCTSRFGVTGDKTRLKICYLLCHYPELSVSQIADIVGLSVSAVSRSLKKLKEIHLVENRKRAKEVHYSLSSSQFAAVVKSQLLSNE